MQFLIAHDLLFRQSRPSSKLVICYFLKVMLLKTESASKVNIFKLQSWKWLLKNYKEQSYLKSFIAHKVINIIFQDVEYLKHNIVLSHRHRHDCSFYSQVFAEGHWQSTTMQILYKQWIILETNSHNINLRSCSNKSEQTMSSEQSERVQAQNDQFVFFNHSSKY